MRVRLMGPFRVWDDQGRDITPKGLKERGLLALLLASPGQRRTRAWLQDKLWSDREPDQASGSMRQALANIRKALGPVEGILNADRQSVWLAPEVPVDPDHAGEFLADLDIRDPEFVEWLRDQRSLRVERVTPAEPAAAAVLAGLPRQRPLVAIRQSDHGLASRSLFLTRAIAQRIAGELILLGDIDVVEETPGESLRPDRPPLAWVDLESYSEGDQGFVLVRVLAAPLRRMLWSGRVSLRLTIAEIWTSSEVALCVNRVVSRVVELLAAAPTGTESSALQRAVRRIYEFDRGGLAKADEMLAGIGGDLRGLALAWRGFIRLTAALEFRDVTPDSVAEARGFADDALRAMADHPVALALASQTRLKMEGDLDQAHYLALRAAELSDQNPYALEALSQTSILHGDYAVANDIAQRARLAAQGLPHSFNWDMQACLTSLSLGQLDVALEAARDCHRKMPIYRPALRYLVALSMLVGKRSDAEYYAGRMRRLEPDFTLHSLLQPGYPLETLRALGHVETLRAHLS